MPNFFDQFDQPVEQPSGNVFDQFDPPSVPVATAGISDNDFDAGQMVKNIPGSALQFGKDIVQPIIHPIQTYEGIRDIGKGALQHMGVVEGGDDLNPTPEQQKASAVKQFFIDRYGSWDAAKNTLEEDPVGFLSDASTVLTGGGALAAKVPMTAAKTAGAVAKTAGRVVDPLNVVTKPVGAIAAPIIGATTGAGSDSLRIAAAARRVNGPRSRAFREGMRGKLPDDYVLTQAKGALAELRDEKHTLYLQNMAATKASQKPINPTPISAAWVSLKNDFTVHGAKGAYWKIDKKHVDLMEKVEATITEWRNDPGLHNAIGLDALKRRIETYRPTNPDPTENRIITTITGKTKQLIEAKEPSYKKAMRDYEQMSAIESDIERTLSLGRNARTDTTMRALLSTLRNNVNTNFGRRRKLLDLLDEKRPGLKEALAGETLNKITPRGIQGTMGLLTGLVAGSIDPTLVGGLSITSPRLMGEAAFAAPGINSLAMPLLFQSGRATDQNLSRRNRGQY